MHGQQHRENARQSKRKQRSLGWRGGGHCKAVNIWGQTIPPQRRPSRWLSGHLALWPLGFCSCFQAFACVPSTATGPCAPHTRGAGGRQREPHGASLILARLCRPGRDTPGTGIDLSSAKAKWDEGKQDAGNSGGDSRLTRPRLGSWDRNQDTAPGADRAPQTQGESRHPQAIRGLSHPGSGSAAADASLILDEEGGPRAGNWGGRTQENQTGRGTGLVGDESEQRGWDPQRLPRPDRGLRGDQHPDLRVALRVGPAGPRGGGGNTGKGTEAGAEPEGPSTPCESRKSFSSGFAGTPLPPATGDKAGPPIPVTSRARDTAFEGEMRF